MGKCRTLPLLTPTPPWHAKQLHMLFYARSQLQPWQLYLSARRSWSPATTVITTLSCMSSPCEATSPCSMQLWRLSVAPLAGCRTLSQQTRPMQLPLLLLLRQTTALLLQRLLQAPIAISAAAPTSAARLHSASTPSCAMPGVLRMLYAGSSTFRMTCTRYQTNNQ